MTKISEKLIWDETDKKMVVQEQHNFQAVADKAKALKSAGAGDLGNDNRLVGLVPMKMWHEWAKKWGVEPGDTDAMKEVLKKELLNSDNSQFRVWDGTY